MCLFCSFGLSSENLYIGLRAVEAFSLYLHQRPFLLFYGLLGFFCSCSTWMDWIIEVFFSLAGGGGASVFGFPLSVFYAGDFG
jgi:hypothetical protein